MTTPAATSHPSAGLEKMALICAVENYFDSELDAVMYGEKDGVEMRNALLNLGYLDENIRILISAQATATTMEYELLQFAKHATRNQTFLFFFAGHGYTYEGKNYLLAYDSRPGNVQGTSVSIARVLDAFEASECSKVMFFLDCCHSGVNWATGTRGVLESLSTEELRAHLAEAEYRVVFSACDKEQKSYPSIRFAHGQWTYQLLRALRGEVPNVLNNEGLLYSGPLQDFLRQEVAANVASETKIGSKRKQHPKMYGDFSGTFIVADLSNILAKQRRDTDAENHTIVDFTLNGTDQIRVRGLSGFRRNHSVPKYVNSTTQKFVASSASPDIEAEMTKIHTAIQTSKRYKSRDLKYYPPSGINGASITTPEFDYNINYEQDEDQPDLCNVTRELKGLNNPELLDLKWFNDIFESKFDCAVFEFSPKIKIALLIDGLEDEGFDVTPNSLRTFFTLSLDEFDGDVVVQPSSITYRFRDADTPAKMNLQLTGAHQSLLSITKIRNALPPGDSDKILDI